MNTHRDAVLTFEYPEHLKQKRGMYFFEGKKRGGVLEMLAIELFPNDAMVEQLRNFILKAPVMSNAAINLTIVRRGESGIRPGMIESLLQTQYKMQGIEGYQWDMMFPVGDKVAKVAIVKTSGNLDEDQPMWERVIQSIQPVGGDLEARADSMEQPDAVRTSGNVLIMSDEMSPHVLLPASLCGEWKGLDEEELLVGGMVDPFVLLDKKTHVGQALGMENRFELLPVGGGFGLVFNGALATGCAVDEAVGALRIASIAEGAGDEDEVVEAAMSTSAAVKLADSGKQWSISDETMVLFDAIVDTPSVDVLENVVRIQGGVYKIFAGEIEDSEGLGGSVCVVELRPVAK